MNLKGKFKITCAALCILTAVQLPSAFAEWRQISGNKIMISDKIESGNGEKPVTINVLKPNSGEKIEKSDVVFHAQTLTKSDGSYEFVFEINGDSGSYKVLINEAGKLAEETISFKKETEKTPDSSGGGGGGGGKPSSSGKNAGSSISVLPNVTEDTAPEKMPEDIFSDLDEAKWAKEAIVSLAEKGIVNGRTEDTFCPNQQMTREEFTKIISDAFLKDAETGRLPFEDTQEDAWYYPYVAKAYSSGAVSGKSNKLFGIGEYITREDMSVILYRILKDNLNKESEEHIFADSDEISDYAKEAVMVFYQNRIISGVGDNCFSPKTNATRAQVAKIVSDILDIL